MQFPAEDDDADFLAAGSSRSRLSSIFMEEKSSSDVNQALTFTAPKQPKKDSAQGNAGTMQLIHAVGVHTYKLKDGNYVNQGKLGCAVLGHHESHTYKLLLYKGKQIPVTVASLTPNFLFHVQPNNYANFYDEKKENWSINFDSEATLIEFTKQVTLARANSQGKVPECLVVQDLLRGEGGQSLEKGDIAEIKYTGWLLTNFGFGQIFDSNMNSESLFRVRLGKGKVIKGLNDGLVGMQKGGKRLLVIPPALAYGSEGAGNTVPANSTLIFEVHVVKVKLCNESSPSPSPVKGSESTAERKPEVPPRHSFSQEDNIRIRGASISEQLTQSPKKDKAQLISRMAKMGTATLPFQGPIPAQVSSDSEPEVEPQPPSSPAPQRSSPKVASKVRSRNNSGSSVLSQPQPIPATSPFQAAASSSPMSLYAQSAMPSQQPFVCAATPFSTYPQQFSVPPQSPYLSTVPGFMPPVSTSAADSQLSFLVSETRNQNCEVRISLSKITDKVDTILQKVDDIRSQGQSTNSSTFHMESAVVLQNIERIIQENTRLKEDNDAKMSKIQSLNEIICDLFQRNPRFSEESTALGQKKELVQAASQEEETTSLQQEKKEIQEYKEKINELNSVISNSVPAAQVREEKERMKEEMNEVIRNKDQIETEMKEMQKKIDYYEELKLSYEDKIRQMESEVDNLRIVKKKYEVFHEKTRSLKESYEKQIMELLLKIKHLQSSNSGMSPQFSVEIKKVMNRLYKILQGKFDAETSYPGSKVLEVVLQSIMALTLQLLGSSEPSTGETPNNAEPSNKLPPQQNISEECDTKPSVEENGLDESPHEMTVFEKDGKIESADGTAPVEQKSESLVSNETPVSEVDASNETPVSQAEKSLSVPVSESSKRESPESPSDLFSGSAVGSKVSEATSLDLHVL